MGESEDFDVPPRDGMFETNLMRRVCDLEEREVSRAERFEDAVEGALLELDDRIESVNRGLGVAFLLIAAVCWAIVLNRSDG